MACSSARHGEDVVLADEDVLLAVQLDLGARVLSEEHGVADLALDRLLLGGVRDDEPALGLGLRLETLDHDSVLQRPDFHDWLPHVLAVAAAPPFVTMRKVKRLALSPAG